MKIDLRRFLATFFEEAAEHIEILEAGLLELEPTGGDPELLNAIFRAAHSIKGGAGSFGLTEVVRFTHVMENLLDQLREGTIAVSADLTGLLLRGVDTLKELVCESNGGDPSTVDMDGLLAELETILIGQRGVSGPRTVAPAAVAPAGHGSWRIRFAPNPDFFRVGQDPLLALRELADLGDVLGVEADQTGLPPLEIMDPEQSYLRWEVRLRTDQGETGLRDVFLFVEDDCELVIGAMATTVVAQSDGINAPERREGDRRHGDRGVGRRTGETTSIRVSIDKVDALIDLVGELVIAQARVNQVAAGLEEDRHSGLHEALASMEHNTRELQEQVLAVRMIPIGTVFNRFPRLVHDLAKILGKDIRLETLGVETELDKGVIEKMGDPLTHLIRNAVDHGIERPEERVAAGKSAQGVLSLSARHQGGNVIIEIADNGRGLDPMRIRAKAISLSMMSADDQLTPDQLANLIFQPGFSTASTISDVSGRGVGMDVVKRNVEALNGSVHVHSEPGQGTRFRIRLPMTLAILDGLQVEVGGEVFVIPLMSIVESLRPAPGDVRQVLAKGEMIVVRGEPLPFVRLSRVFAIDEAVDDPCLGIVVILELDDRSFGVLVDDVLGQSQVVVKSLESNFRKVDAVMGATILGNGEVSLILDIQELYRLANRRHSSDVGVLTAAGAATFPRL